MEQTSARLRKQFQYNSDSDSDSLPEAIDEEEQSHLIASLSAQNAAQNETYTNIFLALPLVCAILYLYLFYANSHSNSRSTASILLTLLALSSLGASAWALVALPPGVTGLQWLDAWMTGSVLGDGLRGSVGRDQKGKGKEVEGAKAARLGEATDKGPLELYLPHLNLALVGFCAILGVVVKNEGGEASWTGLLPATVYGVICVAKGLMGSVDVEGLERLKYPYKGA